MLHGVRGLIPGRRLKRCLNKSFRSESGKANSRQKLEKKKGQEKNKRKDIPNPDIA